MPAEIGGKPWIIATLEAVGGMEGIGVNFLEETFVSRIANPRHRQQQEAARGVRKTLLPELGTDIKGHMRSQSELQEAAGYEARPSDFADLLRILDSELRLITPTDPEGPQSGERSGVSPPVPDALYYQLTHDYLAPSLREWLTRKQKETRKGRAELKLAERSTLWNAKPENRHLPSMPEWLSIRTLTESQRWTEPQRTMMSKAGRRHGMWSGIVLAVTCVLIAIGIGLRSQIEEGRNQVESTRLVEGLLAANTAAVSGTIESLKDFRTWADPQLKQAFADSPEDSNAKLHAGLALVAEGQTLDPAVLRFLQGRLLTTTPSQFGPVRTMLEPHKSDLIPEYWELVLDEQQPAALRFHTACALAAFVPDSSHAERKQSSPHAPREEPSSDSTRTGWNDPNFTRFVANELIADSRVFVTEYRELFRPVAPNLVLALRDIFKDPARGELAKTVTASFLADYAAKDPDTLTELILVADPASDKSLFPVLQQHRAAAVKNLEVVLDQRLEPDWKDAPLDPAWIEPSPAVRARIESAHGLITDRFAFCQDMPLAEFIDVAECLRASGYRPTRVRPWKAHHAERDGYIGAIWHRDNLRWHLDPSLKKSDLPATDAPATVLDQLKPLLAAGWRPFAIAVTPVPSPPKSGEKVAGRPDEGASGAAIRSSPATHFLLHRSIIPDAAKESLALQQAAAATALLRLNAPDKVWPLFQDQPDPRVRSYVLHRLATYGVDPQSLFTQLQQESDVSRQRSLILGIGEFARAKLLSPEQQAAVIADLAKRYADDPNSGIHGAAEWTLRQLGANAEIAEVHAAYSTGKAVGDRRWYLTKTGSTAASSSGLPPAASSLSFAIIDADDEFLMGSPVSEAERFGGPTGKNEIRHRRRIGRRFAIGMHEITVAQFRAFRSDHQFDRTFAREENAPANMITWYDAAAYCNWLSKEEGLPPEQWCYDPDQEFIEGMALVPDYLQRTGYRLPSEAEWENACRAGTTTAHYFGETEMLLGEYAWYTKTSGDKWMLPVGTLRPNGAGLFDMQGNVNEWCQDAALLYTTDLLRMGDKEQAGKLSNSGTRVLRGVLAIDNQRGTIVPWPLPASRR